MENEILEVMLDVRALLGVIVVIMLYRISFKERKEEVEEINLLGVLFIVVVLVGLLFIFVD